MKKFKYILIIVLVICALPSFADSTKKNERWYQEKYCKGRVEVVMQDRTRCDCLNDTHAIEFDFAKKWCEAVGQSLHYGRLTNKKPGIYLIIKTEEDRIYLKRLQDNIKYYDLPIDVFY